MNRATFESKSLQCRIMGLPLPLQIDSAAAAPYQIKRRSFTTYIHAPLIHYNYAKTLQQCTWSFFISF